MNHRVAALSFPPSLSANELLALGTGLVCVAVGWLKFTASPKPRALRFAERASPLALSADELCAGRLSARIRVVDVDFGGRRPRELLELFEGPHARATVRPEFRIESAEKGRVVRDASSTKTTVVFDECRVVDDNAEPRFSVTVEMFGPEAGESGVRYVMFDQNGGALSLKYAGVRALSFSARFRAYCAHTMAYEHRGKPEMDYLGVEAVSVSVV